MAAESIQQQEEQFEQQGIFQQGVQQQEQLEQEQQNEPLEQEELPDVGTQPEYNEEQDWYGPNGSGWQGPTQEQQLQNDTRGLNNDRAGPSRNRD